MDDEQMMDSWKVDWLWRNELDGYWFERDWREL